MGAQGRFKSTIAPNYQGVRVLVPDFGLAGGELLHALETAHEEAKRRIKVRFTRSMMAKQGFKKPKFGSPVYKDYVRKGMITPEEQEADAIMREIRAERAGRGQTQEFRTDSQIYLLSGRSKPLPNHKSTPVRWGREPPIPSDQYAPNMATTAARDGRLTPNAKALFQIIHARCASEGITETTKATLANIMNRSTRDIQRYIADLVQFGYLITHQTERPRSLCWA